MNVYLSIVSLFLLSLGTAYAESLEPERTAVSSLGPNFSFETGELNIPVVIVDGETLYNVKMQLLNSENGMVFSLVDAVSQPPFEELFETITNGMSKQAVKTRLGMPQDINFNLEVKGLYCSQPQLLEVGAIYEQWKYFVDPTAQVSSGFVVWFAKIEGGSEEMLVVDKVNGFSCI